MFRALAGRPLARAALLFSGGGAAMVLAAQERSRAEPDQTKAREVEQLRMMRTLSDDRVSSLRETLEPNSERLIQPNPRKRICVFG